LNWFIQKIALQHILFWICSYTIILYYYSIGATPGLIDHVYTILFHLPLVAGLYINLRVLITKLLDHRYYIMYGIGLVFTPLLMFVSHYIIFTYATYLLSPAFYLVSYIDQMYLYVFYIAYLSVGTLLHLSKSWFEVRESERKLMSMEKEKVQAELYALKSQLQPHFLFNSLNSLYALSLRQAPTLPDMLLKLSEVLRYVIYESDQKEVSLQREVNFLQDYIDLQKLRTPKDRPVNFQVEGALHDIQIAPLLFINFIENAFKHGIPHTDNRHPIHIKLITNQNQVKLTVNNPYNPNEKPYSQSEGKGLENVMKRLSLSYPEQHQLTIIRNETDYRVSLILQLQ